MIVHSLDCHALKMNFLMTWSVKIKNVCYWHQDEKLIRPQMIEMSKRALSKKFDTLSFPPLIPPLKIIPLNEFSSLLVWTLNYKQKKKNFSDKFSDTQKIPFLNMKNVPEITLKRERRDKIEERVTMLTLLNCFFFMPAFLILFKTAMCTHNTADAASKRFMS